MQQHQPQPEFSQDHIVRRLISKFRKPSDAGAIGGLTATGSSNTLQVPQAQHGGLPTVSGALSLSAATGDGSGKASGDGKTSGDGSGGGIQLGGGTSASGSTSAIRSLAGKQSRWSALVASAAAGAASKASGGGGGATSGGGATHGGGSGGSSSGQQHPVSSTRSLLDISHGEQHGESSSNRSSADGRDDEVDENYFRPGGKGHQALLDNMDKR